MPARAHFVPPAYPPERAIEITNGPAAANISDVSVLIWWDTNVKSSSVVHYGILRARQSEYAEGAAKKGHHSVKLANLRPDTTYYFRVESARKGWEPGHSELGTFKTLPRNQETTKPGKPFAGFHRLSQPDPWRQPTRLPT